MTNSQKELEQLHATIADTFTNGIISGYTKELLGVSFFLSCSARVEALLRDQIERAAKSSAP